MKAALYAGLVALLVACTTTATPDVVVTATEVVTPPEPSENPAAQATEDVVEPDGVEARCPAELDLDEASCGFLRVPEDRADPLAQLVEVGWAQLPAVDGEALPGAPPLVVIPDGPGLSGLDEASLWVASPLRQSRDIVLLDPRGTGRSFPSLDCGQPPRPGALPLDLVLDCQDRLTAQGVELAGYSTAAVAADVLDLAAAIGADQVDLLGIGWGARVAMVAASQDPGAVRAVVLDSPIPPQVDPVAQRPVNAQSVVNRLLDACAEDARCATGSDLRQDFDGLVRGLNATASAVEVRGDDLALAAVAALRGADGPAVVPAAIKLALEGRVEQALGRLQATAIAGSAVPSSAVAEGLRLSVDCTEEVPFTDLALLNEPLPGVVGEVMRSDSLRLLEACTAWAAGGPEETADQPLDADVLGLVLAGEFDPLSVPAWAAEAAAAVDAQVVQVGGAGHRTFDVDRCTLGLIETFLTLPAAPLDASCAEGRQVSFEAVR